MIGQGSGGVESYVSIDVKPCLVYWTESWGMIWIQYQFGYKIKMLWGRGLGNSKMLNMWDSVSSQFKMSVNPGGK